MKRSITGLVAGLVLGFCLAIGLTPADAQVGGPVQEVGCYFTTVVTWDGGATLHQTFALTDGGQLPTSQYIATSYCAGVSVVCTMTPGGSASMNITAQLQESNDNVNWIALPGTSQSVAALGGVANNIGWVQWDNAGPLVRVNTTTSNSDGGVLYCTASMKGS